MQFSFARFSHLLKLQIAVNRKLYLVGMLAIAGLILLYMFFVVFTLDSGLTFGLQIDFLVVALLLASSFFGSTIFKQYGAKDKRVQAILLPVSNRERLAVAILFIFLLFPIAFFLIYFLCVLLANAVDVHVVGNINKVAIIGGYERKYLFMLFFFIQSIVLLGAIWFRRQTFVKTLVMVVVLTFAIYVTNSIINNAVLDVKDTSHRLINSSPFQSLRFHGVNQYGHNTNVYYWISLPDSQMIPFMVLLSFIPLFFFYVTALKLREQQL